MVAAPRSYLARPRVPSPDRYPRGPIV